MKMQVATTGATGQVSEAAATKQVLTAAGASDDSHMCDHSTQTTMTTPECDQCQGKSLELCQKAVNLLRELFIKVVEQVRQEVRAYLHL